jgi:hypothetical protein
MMGEDSVLQDVRLAREAYARSHGYNVWAMVADLRRRDERGDWPVVRLDPRHPTSHGDLQAGPNLARQLTRAAAPASGQS